MELIAVLLIALAFLLFVGTPVAIALGLSSVLVLALLDIPLVVAAQRMASGLNIFALMAIPLFILSGELMTQSGIARRLIDLADGLVGRAPGGLGQVTIVSSMMFGAVSGSAVASAAAMGSALGPAMTERGYDKDYAVNVTTTASITGLLIPPSHNMIIYATAAGDGVSVGHLFLAGIVPGLVTGAMLMIAAGTLAVRRGYPVSTQPSLRDVLGALVMALPGIMTAIIIVGGILGGVFTATESAAVACVYTAIIGAVVYRGLGPGEFKQAIAGAAKTTSIVMFIIATAALFGWVLALLHAPTLLAEFMSPLMTSPALTMLSIVLMLLILGTFMDMAPLILITTPIFLPIAISVGMDPTHFGVVLMLSLGIGLVTPPVGSVLFVGCAVQNITMGDALKSIWPFYVALVLALIAVLFVPSFSLWLPGIFV